MGRERVGGRQGGGEGERAAGGIPPDPGGGWFSSGSGGTKFPLPNPTLPYKKPYGRSLTFIYFPRTLVTMRTFEIERVNNIHGI